MRILWLTARFPLPPIKGDRLRSYHLITRLARRHDIDLVTFATAEDRKHFGEMRGYVGRLVAIPFSRAWRCLGMLPRAIGRLPFQVSLHRSAAFRRKVIEMHAASGYDAVICTTLRMAGNLPEGLDCALIGDFIDSMTLNFSNRLRREKGPLRMIVREEVRRLASYERKAADRFDRVFVVSERDREAIGGGNVCVVPIGVDTDAFAPDPGARIPSRIVFTGNLSYFPNVDGAGFFAREVFPLVREKCPQSEFVLAGANPCRQVMDLARLPGVRVEGFVESMSAFINTASVAVCPMRSGSGIQNKMLEAMACGVPVVASRFAAEGLAAEAGADFVLANGAEETADRVCGLLSAPESAAEVGAAGRRYVERHASWDRAAALCESELCEAVEKGREASLDG